MKIKTLLLILLLAFNLSSKAQFVNIPDANFATWLATNYPTCMSGSLMDTTCGAIISADKVVCANQQINNLSGIQYFDGLDTLYCGANNLTSLPQLPSNLKVLSCGSNPLVNLPNLPTDLEALLCSNSQLTTLPALPSNLKKLYCDNNDLTTLPTLPSTLTALFCDYNSLTSLPSLPTGLTNFDCSYNNLTALPILPAGIQELFCSYNNLNFIPNFPDSLKKLFCQHNSLASFPVFPPLLNEIFCYNNNLTYLPALPNGLYSLSCENNFLTSLPSFSDSINYLDCQNNNIHCFPVFPDNFSSPLLFSIDNNPFNCLPNYISAMNPTLLAYPLCTNGNSNGCLGAQVIEGHTYKDNNGNCLYNVLDQGLNNVPLQLFDFNNNFNSQTYSFYQGIYSFANPFATYKVVVDTTLKPYTITCAHPGIDSTVALSVANPIANVDFEIACKPGFDVGVQSVVPTGLVFPGEQHRLNILAGDMSNWYNLNCAAGVSGTVQVTFSGNVNYDSIYAAGSLIPSVAGNVLTYTIPDFGAIDFLHSFVLFLTTDTTALAGDTVCINISVTPTSGDNNLVNNNFTFCYFIGNSFDPNNKEVFPVNVLPGFSDWFTYTIHFQNTGAAPAINIRLLDSLDSHLDLSTFEIINYSHPNAATLNQNILTVRFSDILLPDSGSNLTGSQGYIQYRIKPLPNLPAGTVINNKANIYFDYNAPILTNTTSNEFLLSSSSSTNIVTSENDLIIFPNPSNGQFQIKKLDKSEVNIRLFNLLGEEVFKGKLMNEIETLNLSHLSAGVYWLSINSKTKTAVKKIVINADK
jgi:uncharacterized repeat protein (TIGR01451 family)